MSPPKNGKAGSDAGNPLNSYSGSIAPLVERVKTGWQKELTRLLTEFTRTGNTKHLIAAKRHFGAMMAKARL